MANIIAAAKHKKTESCPPLSRSVTAPSALDPLTAANRPASPAPMATPGQETFRSHRPIPAAPVNIEEALATGDRSNVIPQGDDPENHPFERAEFEGPTTQPPPSTSNSSAHIRGRLRNHMKFWLKICLSTLVLAWIAHGYKLEFDPALGEPRDAWFSNHPGAYNHSDFVDEALTTLLQTGAIECRGKKRPKVVSPLGVVPKKGGKSRLILDLRYVNKHLIDTKFRYETPADLEHILKQGDYLFAFDLRSGYHHVEMHASSIEYLGFEWKGQFYVFTCLPFGLKPAPWVFTKIMRELVGWWRNKGFRLLPYLDDFIFGVRPDPNGDCTAACRVRDQVIADLDAAGLLLAEEKSTLTPVKILDHLGFTIDTTSNIIAVTQDRWDKLQGAISKCLVNARHVAAKTLARCTGQIISCKLALGPVASLMTKASYLALESRKSWFSYLSLPDACIQELTFWKGVNRSSFTSPLTKPPHHIGVQVFSDASAFGWGGHLLDPTVDPAQGYLTIPERAGSSTYRELTAVLYTLQSFSQFLQGRVVTLYTDSQTTESIVAKGTMVAANHDLAVQIFLWCLQQGVKLHVVWIPRDLNAKADAISKWWDYDDWQLNPELFRVCCERWGQHNFDRFASHTNHQCSLFNSFAWCPGTQGVDAFAQVWTRAINQDTPVNNWCNPPFRLIGQVVELLQEQRATATVIIPVWPKQYWWPTICPDGVHLAPYVVDWLEFDTSYADVFLPGPRGANAVAQAPPAFRVLALRISFDHSYVSSLPNLSLQQRCTSSRVHCAVCGG